MSILQEQVTEFHKKAGLAIGRTPSVPSEDEQSTRLRLIEEELEELRAAFEANDLTGIADSVGDLLYVVMAVAVVSGLDMDAISAEIHRSNMTKANGHIDDWTGKFIKPDDYDPPKLDEIILAQAKRGVRK